MENTIVLMLFHFFDTAKIPLLKKKYRVIHLPPNKPFIPSIILKALITAHTESKVMI